MMFRLLPYMLHHATRAKMASRLSSCVLTNKSKPLAISNNTSRSAIRGVICCSLHTEISSLLKYYGRSFQNVKGQWRICEKKYQPKKVSLFVVRIDRDNNPKMAKPCLHCLESLQKLNVVKNIYYTTGNGDEVKCEKIRDITNNHVSHGNRNYARTIQI